MPKERIYFCQGCSAVLSHRLNYCPYCGDKQYYTDKCEHCGTAISENDKECPECLERIYTDEEKTRYCPWCGNNLDLEERNLNKKYCWGDDCGKEIGGLIRYSEETGEPLNVEEILSKNDYDKEITDWLTSIYNEIGGYYYPTFSERMLYIYDKTGKYSVNDFKIHLGKILDDIYIHTVADFLTLSSDENLKIIKNKELHPPKNYQHCLCVIGIKPFDKKTEIHDEFKGEWGNYIPNFENSKYPGNIYKKNVSFVFISSVIPELTQIGNIYDKYFLIISPEILNSIDISTIWKEIRKKDNGK